jgi:YbbR domain-containing protein
MLLDNLGLKLVAVLLAVLVYLNAYTDRPATMRVSFPVQIAGLPDSLSVSGAFPAAIQAELRGTGKQLIRLRVTEPAVKVSLDGVGPGRYSRAITPADLPVPEGVEISVDRVSPRVIEIEIDRRERRTLPVAGRHVGDPAADAIVAGSPRVHPRTVLVSGPRGVLAGLDSVRLLPVSIAGRRDTLVALVTPDLPAWCTAKPAEVEVTVPIALATVRRVALEVGGAGAPEVAASPPQVTAEVRAPRGLPETVEPGELRVRWVVEGAPDRRIGRRVPVRLERELGPPFQVRLVPDSVTLVRGR